MAILLLADLRPGMRLARGVLTPQGALLAKPGDEITDKQIRLFKMWGVVEAEVADSEAGDAAYEDEGDDAVLDPGDRIDRLFEPHLDDPVMYQIATFAKQLVSQRRR